MSECSGNSLAMQPRPAGRLEAFFLAACARPTTYSMAARVAHGGGREVLRAVRRRRVAAPGHRHLRLTMLSARRLESRIPDPERGSLEIIPPLDLLALWSPECEHPDDAGCKAGDVRPEGHAPCRLALCRGRD